MDTKGREIVPDIKAEQERLVQRKADAQARKADRELRRTYLAALSAAITDVRAATNAEHDKRRAASKAFTPGQPAPAFPTITFHFDELITLERLRIALGDVKTPFPPEYLADKWAAFKASRGRPQ